MHRYTLPATAQSARAGRMFVTDFGRCNAVPGAILDDAVLLVSEIVSNAYVHAGSGVRLGVSYLGQVLHVEVADDSPMPPLLSDPGTDATGGRGILLLDAMSARWGVQPHPPAKSSGSTSAPKPAGWLCLRRPASVRGEDLHPRTQGARAPSEK